jgi:hypothetical protein
MSRIFKNTNLFIYLIEGSAEQGKQVAGLTEDDRARESTLHFRYPRGQ